MKQHKWILILTICLGLSVHARGAGYEFEGVGARAVSRGGAVVADSNDWTAMYWNPGNITAATSHGKKDFGVEVFGGTAYAKDSNSLSNLVGPAFQKNQIQSSFILGALGGALPLSDRTGLAFGVYTPLLQGVTFRDRSSSVPNLTVSDTARIGILTTTLSLGHQITDQFSAGAGVDLLYGRIKNNITVDNLPVPLLFTTDNASTKLEGSGLGLEGIFGLSYQAKPDLKFGAVYRTGSDMKLRGRATTTNSVALLGSGASNFRFDLRHPPTLGVGSAWDANSKLILSFDVDRTFWRRFSNSLQYDQSGGVFNSTPNTLHWRDSWKLRAGSEYKLSEKNKILSGFAFDWYALDSNSIDLSTVVDTDQSRLTLGWAHHLSDKTELVLGGLGAYGTRHVGNVHYRLAGWQAMLEYRFMS